MNLEFDPTRHSYRLDGRELPSVTTILRHVGLINADWFTEESRLIGEIAHQCVEYQIAGVLDESSVDHRIEGYLAAWLDFRAKTRIEIELSEHQTHYRGQFAGTLDIFGTLRRRKTVIDIKTGQSAKWHALQTAAYAACVGAAFRGCLYLHHDGSFAFEQHADPNDFGVFMSALALFNWKRNCGLVEWPGKAEAA